MNEKVKDGVFKGYKVGDKVWNITNDDWEEITYINTRLLYAIAIGDETYTSNGKSYESDTHPTIFPNEWKIPDEAFIKPLPNLKVDTKVLVWGNNEDKEFAHNAYFSHFGKDGRLNTFTSGRTLWSGKDYPTVSWDNYEVVGE